MKQVNPNLDIKVTFRDVVVILEDPEQDFDGVEFSEESAAALPRAHDGEGVDAAAQHIHVRRLQQQDQRLVGVGVGRRLSDRLKD